MIQIGDILSVQYFGFKHYGIYIGLNTVIHNSKDSGKVEEIDFQKFQDNKAVSISTIKSYSPKQSVDTARQYIGQKYNLFSENCEHFVRKISGKKESVQVQKYVIASLGAFLLFKSSNNVVKAMGATAIATALLTDSESSPMTNTLITTGLVGGAMLLSEQ